MESLRHVSTAVLPPMFNILGKNYDTPQARVMLLAIGLQESRLTERKQIGGPARGLWQFERGGGVRGVLNHKASRQLAVKLCDACFVPPTVDEVYQTLQYDDVLAAGFARLLLLTDPRPLPALGEVEEAWLYYLETWRPGKPHRHTWDALYAKALAHVRGGK